MVTVSQQMDKGTEKHFLTKIKEPRVKPPALSSIICPTFSELFLAVRHWGYSDRCKPCLHQVCTQLHFGNWKAQHLKEQLGTAEMRASILSLASRIIWGNWEATISICSGHLLFMRWSSVSSYIPDCLCPPLHCQPELTQPSKITCHLLVSLSSVRILRARPVSTGLWLLCTYSGPSESHPASPTAGLFPLGAKCAMTGGFISDKFTQETRGEEASEIRLHGAPSNSQVPIFLHPPLSRRKKSKIYLWGRKAPPCLSPSL